MVLMAGKSKQCGAGVFEDMHQMVTSMQEHVRV